MLRSKDVLDSLTRQEQMLQQLLCSCYSLHGRMERVEGALGIEVGTVHVASTAVAASVAGCQMADTLSPIPQCVNRHSHMDENTGTTRPKPQKMCSSEMVYGAPGGAIGESAAQHDAEGQSVPTESTTQTQEPLKTTRQGIAFSLRPGSFQILTGRRRLSSNEVCDSKHDIQGKTDFMRVLSRKCDDTGASILSDEFDAAEDSMWEKLTLTDFWQHLELFCAIGRPMPFRHKLRMLVQMPHAVSAYDLMHMFLEEDTVGILTNVVQPLECGSIDGLVVFLLGVIHPGSVFKIIWDFYMMATLFTVLIATPFVICFDIGYARISMLGIWEVIVDASFWVDIVLNFRTAFTEPSAHVDEALVTSYRRIVLRYIRGFFILDFVSTVPWDLVNASMGLAQLFKISKVGKLVRVMRMLKITKMLRVFKAPKALKQLELRIGRVLTRVLWLVCSVVFILHISACIFHFSALLSSSKTTWVDSSGIVDASSIVDLYVTSMYWAMSTMATVGYGDVTPIQIAEKLVSMFGMLAGVTVFAYIMSTVSVLLSSINAQNIRIAERQRQLDSFCRAHKVPPGLAMKLSQFYEYVLPRQVHDEDMKLLTDLSGTLRQQVLLTMNASALDKLPFLRSKHPQFLEKALSQLKLEFYAPGEYVIWQGDLSTEMYFIVEGKLEVRVHERTTAPSRDTTDLSPKGNDVKATGPVSEARVVPGTKSDCLETGSMPSDVSTGAGADVSVDEGHPKFRRISRQMSKMRLRRLKKDPKVSNRMIGVDKGPYKKVGKLLAGEYFGEVACWTGDRRTASVVTVTSCELYCLQRAALLRLVDMWPDLADELKFKTITGGNGVLNKLIVEDLPAIDSPRKVFHASDKGCAKGPLLSPHGSSQGTHSRNLPAVCSKSREENEIIHSIGIGLNCTIPPVGDSNLDMWNDCVGSEAVPALQDTPDSGAMPNWECIPESAGSGHDDEVCEKVPSKVDSDNVCSAPVPVADAAASPSSKALPPLKHCSIPHRRGTLAVSSGVHVTQENLANQGTPHA